MKEIKDTVRSRVRIGYDGSVHKTFHGTNAAERYATEVRTLRYLEEQKCDFVPRVIECDDEKLHLVTTNCGAPVQKMSDEKVKSIFAELREYGVEHGDEFLRNITYDSRRGRFCLIDFELATILDEKTDAPAEQNKPSDPDADTSKKDS